MSALRRKTSQLKRRHLLALGACHGLGTLYPVQSSWCWLLSQKTSDSTYPQSTNVERYLIVPVFLLWLVIEYCGRLCSQSLIVSWPKVLDMNERSKAQPHLSLSKSLALEWFRFRLQRNREADLPCLRNLKRSYENWTMGLRGESKWESDVWNVTMIHEHFKGSVNAHHDIIKGWMLAKPILDRVRIDLTINWGSKYIPGTCQTKIQVLVMLSFNRAVSCRRW
jgi:hypothetical protein